MSVLVVDHPLAQDRLTILRDHTAGPGLFRATLHELSLMLVYEALRTQPTATVPVRTPVGEGFGRRVTQPPVVVPILRGGLGMAGATAALVPDAATCFVGLARDPVTQLPRLYLNALPQRLGERTVLVLDPMLASGRSVASCCELVVEQGGRDIVVVCAIAAREGLQLLERSGLPIRILTAAIDEKLNADGYVVPGMGDAGDRQFDEGSAAGTGAVAVEGPLVADDGQQVRPPGYPTEFGAGLR